MKRTLTVNHPASSNWGALMLAEESNLTRDIVNAGLMTNRLKTSAASGTTAIWANAVWGTRPSSNPHTPNRLPPLSKSCVLQVWSTQRGGVCTTSLTITTPALLHQTAKAAPESINLPANIPTQGNN